MSAKPRRGRPDKFARPTNRYQQEQHDLKRAKGFEARRCPACDLLRWYSKEEIEAGAQMCGVCAQHGAPGKDLPASHGLRPDQRFKRGEMQSE